MSDRSALAAALQLADSSLPIGRFVHSYGLESWLHERSAVSPETLSEWVAATVSASVAPLDGAIVALAHRAGSSADLGMLDRHLTARKLTPAARIASQTCGRQLAALAPALAPDDELVACFGRLVRDGTSDGNIAVVQGTLARALGVPATAAVLIEVRGAAVGQLSAAVRLGAISPTQAQAVLARLAPVLTRAVEHALSLDLHELHSTAPELELYALSHRRVNPRLFST
jgi:urease accessory protein